MTGGYRTLPVRRWLLLALAVVFLVPVIVTAVVAGSHFGGPWQAQSAAVQALSEGASRWHDATWQEATRVELARQGVDFVLLEAGREIYRSTADPVAATNESGQRVVQALVIPNSAPRMTAHIYSDWGAEGDGLWRIPVVGFGTLLLTLAVIAGFLGRTLVSPLAATSRAARQVAAGDLEVELPRSRVREVAELNASFTAMSSELRASLRHQAELEQERRLFIGAIAHDLRTPLFSLRGYLDGLERGLASTPKKRDEYIAVCREKADVLARLVADLFAYTKVEYLEQAVQREPLDLGTLLERVVEEMQPRARAKDVTLEFHSEPDSILLEGDEHLLRRVIENLLDNALRHTPVGGRVEVRRRSEPDRVTFAVADTGPGISPRDLPHVFDPLYRGDPARNQETGGTGLGLAIARRILRAHGGDIAAANGPMGGATFTAWLPRRSAGVTANRTPESSEGQ